MSIEMKVRLFRADLADLAEKADSEIESLIGMAVKRVTRLEKSFERLMDEKLELEREVDDLKDDLNAANLQIAEMNGGPVDA